MKFIKENKNTLESYWKKCSNDELFYQTLIYMYGESHRFYHTCEHLLKMFYLLDELNLSLSRRDMKKIYFAIFFHDLVYDPKLHNNEEKSSEAWIVYSEVNKIDADLCLEINEMILATKRHVKTKSFITNLFLDLDLSILGSSTDDFNKYEESIRKEYNFVPFEIYDTERRKVMSKFVGEYFTEIMEAKLGKKRLNNLMSRYFFE